MRSFYEEAIAIVALALFLGSLYVWSVMINDHIRRERAGLMTSGSLNSLRTKAIPQLP